MKQAELTAPEAPDAASPARKIFTRKDSRPTVTVSVYTRMYEDFAPFVFEFRLSLSREQKEKREQWLSLSAVDNLAKAQREAIEEVADLLVREPEGFGDFPVSERPLRERAIEYFSSDEFLGNVAEAANTLYYNKILPREFRP